MEMSLDFSSYPGRLGAFRGERLDIQSIRLTHERRSLMHTCCERISFLASVCKGTISHPREVGSLARPSVSAHHR